MISLASSATIVSPSQTSIDKYDRASNFYSPSSSTSSLNLLEDEENITIKGFKPLPKRKSDGDLQLLAISSHITELQFSISDIQTRIFAIQELRHESHSSGNDSAGTSSSIDESLVNLDERLASVSKGMKSIAETLESVLPKDMAPSSPQLATLARKHATLVSDWASVQEEGKTLREELKEDKWLTVFRTVTDQADGMMSSLEKAVNRCQDFIIQVHRRGPDDVFLSRSASQSSLVIPRDKGPPTIETFNGLLESFEAKKKHYMPATSKVLSIIDKGVQDRVTKNGETLRRHAESAQRWRNLRERIAKTDADMEWARRILLNHDLSASDAGSSVSGHSGGKLRNGEDARSKVSTASTLSRSISPFRKLARKLTGANKDPPPVTPASRSASKPQPSSEPPALRRQRSSIFHGVRPNHANTPLTPERPGHKYSQSLTPDSSPRNNNLTTRAPSSAPPKGRPLWNSSTKVVSTDEKSATIRATPPRRPPSSTGRFTQDGSPHKRSLSRTSMASSRPWSPVTSSATTSNSSHPPMPNLRPPSRAQTPPNQHNPSNYLTPRRRPKTPSHIPMPVQRVFSSQKSDAGFDDESIPQPPFSPTFSASGRSPGSFPPRPPSRSMIPVPSFQFSSASRPSSVMSQFTDSGFRTISTRSHQVDGNSPTRSISRSISSSQPPSSYHGSTSHTRAPSRSISRAGAYTPSNEQYPIHEYTPSNLKDPLDVEVALIANSIPHGLVIERIDPPLKTTPREGEEIRAQYAFSNALARKVVNCKLTTLARPGKSDPTKKVMCRVGGGWQDLHLYILSRQG